MKNNNLLLDRLIRGARQSSRDQTILMPFGFETRVLAALDGVGLSDESLWLLTLFRRAMFLACGVTVACWFAASLWIPEAAPNEVTLADSIMKLSLLP